MHRKRNRPFAIWDWTLRPSIPHGVSEASGGFDQIVYEKRPRSEDRGLLFWSENWRRSSILAQRLVGRHRARH